MDCVPALLAGKKASHPWYGRAHQDHGAPDLPLEDPGKQTGAEGGSWAELFSHELGLGNYIMGGSRHFDLQILDLLAKRVSVNPEKLGRCDLHIVRFL